MAEQLRMFMSPDEIRQQYKIHPSEIEEDDFAAVGLDSLEDPEPEDLSALHEEFWNRKEDEAWDDGTYGSVEESGVRTPISLGPAHIGNGHHRLISALMSGKQFVPVLHYSDHQNAMRSGFDANGQLTDKRWQFH